jgi:hypothetical protein
VPRRWLLLGIASTAASVACAEILGVDDVGYGTASNDGGADSGGPDSTPPLDASSDAGTDAGGYRAVVLADHPIVYWRMGTPDSDLRIVDETGRGNYLQLAGNVVSVPGGIAGDPNTAIGFDGVSAVGRAIDRSALDFHSDAGAEPFTLEAWLNHAPASGGNGSQQQMIFSNVEGVGAGFIGYQLYGFTPADGGPGLLRLQTERDVLSGIPTECATAALPDGVWTHVVFVYTVNSQALYIDNQQVTCPGDPRVFDPRTSGEFDVAFWAQSDYFAGALDELALYDHALSPGQVAAHYHAGTALGDGG